MPRNEVRSQSCLSKKSCIAPTLKPPAAVFAAGYSACFLGALKYVAGQQKVTLPATTSIDGSVGIGQLPTGFGIEVELAIRICRDCRTGGGELAPPAQGQSMGRENEAPAHLARVFA